jgi:lysozyme
MANFNQAGLELLEKWEGCILYAYDDANDQPVKPGQHVYGTLTIGYGHTGSDVFPGLVWSQDEANEALEHDVSITSSQIQPLIRVDLNDNQFSAFVCLAFNIGVHAFAGSSALAFANRGDLVDVPDHIMLWNKTTINGHIVTSAGLTNRRQAECDLWSTPNQA